MVGNYVQDSVVGALKLKCAALDADAILVMADVNNVIYIEVDDELGVMRDEKNLASSCYLTELPKDSLFDGLLGYLVFGLVDHIHAIPHA